MENLEVNAKSVDEAVEIALRELGAKLSEVEIVILSEGRAGILGLGAEDARVRVSKLAIGRSRMSAPNFPPRPPAISYAPQAAATAARAPEPLTHRGDAGPEARAGREVLEALLARLGLEAEVIDTQPPTPPPSSSGSVVAFDIRGNDLGLLIGRRGQTLTSLQYVVNLIVNRRHNSPLSVVVDVEGYRARRYQTLRGLAQRMADRVRTTGQTVTLEPMTAAERRIIHLALQDYSDVTTQSDGEGENRKVSIMRKRQ
jgi:spoIIIJ-associated protein